MDPQLIIMEVKAHAIMRLDENPPRIEKCLMQLNNEEIWKKPNKSLNSVGNLVLHVCGNMTQYVISSIGGEPDDRHRDREFEASGEYNRDQLLEMIYKTVAKVGQVIKGADAEELMRERSVQGFNYSGIGIIIHVVEHLSYHTGQIAFLTKLLKNSDLGFYAGVDLNTKNK